MAKIFCVLFTILYVSSIKGQYPIKANMLYDQEKYLEAIEEYKAIIPEIINKVGAKDTLILLQCYVDLAGCFEKVGLIDSSVVYCKRLFDIVNFHNIQENETFQVRMIGLGHNLIKLKRYTEVEYFMNYILLQNSEKVLDKLILYFYDVLQINYNESRNETKLIHTLIIRENVIRNKLSLNDKEIIKNLEHLSILYESLFNYQKAEVLLLEAKSKIIDVYGNNSIEFVEILISIGQLYNKSKNYNSSEFYFDQATSILKNIKDDQSKLKIKILEGLIGVYRKTNNYYKADHLVQELIVICKNINDCDIVLNNSALFYIEIGNYEKAILILEKIMSNYKELKTFPDYLGYVKIKQNLALAYDKQGKFGTAMNLYLDCIEILDNFEYYDKEYVTIINNMVNIDIKMNNLEFAEKWLTRCFEIIDKKYGRESLEYGEICNTAGVIMMKKGEYGNAINFLNQSMKIFNSIDTFSSLKKPYILHNLGSLYEVYNDNLNAGKIYSDFFNLSKSQIIKNFSFMTENEKELNIINFKNYNLWYKNFLHKNYKNQNELSASYFDIELFEKKLILNSLREKSFLIETNMPHELKARYEEWIKLKKLIVNRKIKTNTDETSVILLQEEANSLEKLLFKNLILSNKQGNLGWQDIKSKLNSNNVAIEFSSFRYRTLQSWTDSIFYVALILRPNDSYPQMIKLCEQKQLDSIFFKTNVRESSYVNNICKSDRLYELIWKPIEKYVKMGNQIYFSPSGLIHKISLSAIANSDSTYLSDQYNFYQVGSTALLATEDSSAKSVKDVVIFGGIDFDASEEQIAIAAKDIVLSDDIVSRSLYTQDSTRSGKWTYLYGTLDEAQSIDKMAKSKNIQSQLFTGAKAIEERFKSLNGKKSPSVVHIATHGFFFPDPKVDKKRLEFMSSQSDNTFTLADNPMNRSGLLFAGGNKAWIGEELSTDREDGILTAYEVSNMSLFNTELVVLSACETGLGDIKGSEGVYGLQRAFKQAGVRYLMMSLWKVPDLATKEFMTTFYKEYLTHQKPVREAFNATQSKMKDKYRNEPYKWGGFVLME